MKKIYVCLLCILSVCTAYGQNTFQRTFGGGKKDNAFEIIGTKDKGFMTIGSTTSFGMGKNDIYLVKMDSIGNLQWAKTFGGTNDDFGRSMDKTKDGNYIIGGQSLSFSKDYTDLCLMKVDDKGNLIWSKTYGLDRSDYMSCIRSTKDGGFIVLGETINFLNHEKNSDMLVIRMDATGKVLWAKVYGGNNTDYGYSIQETTDGGFIIGGETNSYGAGEWDFYMLKLKKDGVVEWSKTFGEQKSDFGRYAIQTEDGGYLLGGNTYNFEAQETDVMLIKMSNKGDVEWTKTYGGTDTDYLLSLKKLEDNKFIITGYTNSFGLMVEDAFVMEVNSKGKVIMSKAFGGQTHDYGLCAIQQNDEIIMCGTTESFGASDEDVYVVRTKLKWMITECNASGLYPLNVNSKVDVKIGTGSYEFELHCQESPIEVSVSNSLTAEQVLCVEEAEE